MRYSLVADTYKKIEDTTKRLEMTDYLVELLKQTPKTLIDKVVYLTQGKLYPDFVGIEIGVAEKLAIRAVSRATGHSEKEIVENLEKTGDLGDTTQHFLERKTQISLYKEPLTVQRMYETLDGMAKSAGAGSTEQKISRLSGILINASPKEGKYVIRTVTGRLRLGIADMTVLDALAVAYGGGKETRGDLERAYNISSDLGMVAKTVLDEGVDGARMFRVSVGKPIRPMLAERLSSAQEILEKLEGKCIAEFKYDGERMQAHKKNDKIILFSRRLKTITEQYPDGAELIRKHITANEAIIEAECVAVDPETGDMRAFQELMRRRRKHEIKKTMDEQPIGLFIFDVLHVDGEDLTLQPYSVRHERLEEIVSAGDRVKLAEYCMVDSPEKLELFFEKAIENGCEGVICKAITKKAVYRAGARGWLWIKYKRDYKREMADTLDLVAVGAYHGRGRRAGAYGALLIAAYNKEEDCFETVTKCGTGFTDEDLKRLPELMNKHMLQHRHPRLKAGLDADVWFEPSVVIEVTGAEITLSPIHTCAMDIIRNGRGLALRFPRFTGSYRLDKSAEDATTVKEIVEMYRSQLKQIRKRVFQS